MNKDFTFAHREEGFDNHIDMSIRHYSTLHRDVVDMSQYFVEDDTNVVDIGCSTGKTLAQIISKNSDTSTNVNYIGYEIAEGFSNDMKTRMSEYSTENLTLLMQDVREVNFTNCSLITSLFTLQFMSIKDRRDVIASIYKGLNKGGAFIFSEKIYSSSSKIQDMLTFLYYDYKRGNFSEADILSKEVTLRSMLKPNTRAELISMLTIAGFEHIEFFWQNHLFVGIIAIK